MVSISISVEQLVAAIQQLQPEEQAKVASTVGLKFHYHSEYIPTNSQ